nr:hypothetical protein [Paenibacillus polymyxa]
MKLYAPLLERDIRSYGSPVHNRDTSSCYTAYIVAIGGGGTLVTAHLVWILLIYGVGAAVVHLMYIRQAVQAYHNGEDAHAASPDRRATRYIVITSNDGDRVEWVMRSLSILAWLHRRPLHVTVLDDESIDDTLPILTRLVRYSHMDVSVISRRFSPGNPVLPKSGGEKQVVIDLRTANPLAGAPLVP